MSLFEMRAFEFLDALDLTHVMPPYLPQIMREFGVSAERAAEVCANWVKARKQQTFESGKSSRLPKQDLFKVPVSGVQPDELSARLRASIDAVKALWPEGTMVTLFVADFGAGGGLTYISNGDRAGMIETVREWLEHQHKLS